MTRDPAAKEGRGYTREPWTANFTRYDGGAEGFHIAGVERGSSYEICGFVLQKGDNPAEAEANARRIVACVNALEGIPTDAIEAGAITGSPVQLKADRDHLRERIKELEEALGDLLSAVEHNLSTGTERHKARILLSKSPK